MLIQVLRSDAVARCRRLSGERHIAFEHLIRVAANLHVRAIAVEGLHAVRWARAAIVGIVRIVPTTAAAAVATSMPLVLPGSHDTLEIAIRHHSHDICYGCE